MTGHNRANVIFAPDYEKKLINELRYFCQAHRQLIRWQTIGELSSVLLGVDSYSADLPRSLSEPFEKAILRIFYG